MFPNHLLCLILRTGRLPVSCTRLSVRRVYVGLKRSKFLIAEPRLILTCLGDAAVGGSHFKATAMPKVPGSIPGSWQKNVPRILLPTFINVSICMFVTESRQKD